MTQQWYKDTACQENCTCMQKINWEEKTKKMYDYQYLKSEINGGISFLFYCVESPTFSHFLEERHKFYYGEQP